MRCMVRCMQRTNIYLEERQAVALDAVARRQGISRAELVRRLIDRGLSADTATVAADLEVISASFGVLADEEISTRTRTAREEYLDRLWQS